ncbi:squalene synthase HpnC [Plantactinospora sp. GCM10030261]|uniref:squalene synthase HpnC n=1 Tax=Plantactinospora sp. GCM10030261 TaxID=3273420 RepID=UPI00360F63F1
MLDLTPADRGEFPASTADIPRPPDSVVATENFPVALRVLPARHRGHLLALYRYARYVDDLGDEPDPYGRPVRPADRLAALDAFADQVRDLAAGRPVSHPVLTQLAPTMRECDLPAAPLLRLVEANRTDQLVDRCPSYQHLLAYCHASADPVGELVLHVFGAATPDRIALSDCVCTALQIVEHLQDVGEDYRRGRVYLPSEDLVRFGVCDNELAARHASGPLRAVLHFEAQRVAALLDAGAPLLRELPGWSRVAVAGYLAGGRAALDALRRSGYDPLPGPPRTRRLGIARHWLLAMLGAAR